MSRLPLLLLCSALSLAAPTRFEVRDMTHRNVLTVISDAPLEKVVGTCHTILGWIEIDPENLAAGIKGEIEADLRTFDTGIEIRNSVVREKFLDVAQYPTAQASFVKWSKAVTGKLSDAQAATHQVDAVIKYRDKTVNVSFPLKMAFFREGELTKQRLTGNLFRVAAHFPLELAQMGVVIPESMRGIVAKNVEVSLDAVGSDKLPLGTALLPEGPKPKDRDPSSKRK